MPATYSWTGDEERWSQDQKLASMAPAFRTPVLRTIARLRARGWSPTIIYAWRSIETQARLLAERNTTVDFSFHNNIDDNGQPAALGVDIVDTRYAWGGDDTTSQKYKRAMAFFKDLGADGKAEGLYWGGDWRTFKDYAHLQMHPNASLRSIKDAAKRTWERLKAATGSSSTTPASTGSGPSGTSGGSSGPGASTARPAQPFTLPAVTLGPFTSTAANAANTAVQAARNMQQMASGAAQTIRRRRPRAGLWIGGSLGLIALLALAIFARR